MAAVKPSLTLGVTTGAGVVNLDGTGVVAPPEFAATLLKESFEGSVVGQVSNSQPMPLSGQTIPVYDGDVEVSLVAEAAAKPRSSATFETKSISVSKVATIVVVSKEAAQANPAKMLELVQDDMRNAISRAVDSLVLFNRDPRGNAYSGSNVSVVGAGNAGALYLGAGALDADALLAAYDLAADSDSADPNAWLFDTRQRGAVTRLTQDVQNGLPDLRGGASVVAGLPAFYNRGVRNYGDPATVAGIVGDFDKVRWGFVERLDIQRSTEATVGGESMFETNQVALLIEAQIGWTVLDQSAFAVIRTGVDPD